MRKARRIAGNTPSLAQLREAGAKIASLEAQVQVLEEKCRTRGAERDAALQEAKTTRDQFANLKKLLLDSETECARLRGYLERVREDDAVADPLVEVEDQNGKRMVSKRWPSNHMQNAVHHNFDGGTYEQYTGRHEKPKHWITY